MTRITIDCDQLLKDVTACTPMTNRRHAMAILSCVSITTRSTGIEVAATDLDVTRRQELGCDVDGDAVALLVNAKALANLLKTISDITIVIDIEGGDEPTLVVKTLGGEFKIHAISTQGYPALPASDADLELDPASLLEAIQHSEFCVSTDDSRPNLNGLYIHADEDEECVNCVATDGHRLALSTRKVGDFAKALDGGIIVAHSALKPVKDLLKSAIGLDTFAAIEESNLILKTQGARLYVRLIDLKFPDYRAVMPKHEGNGIRVKRTALEGALKRVTLFASDRTKSASFDFVGDTLGISSENADLGNGVESIVLDAQTEARAISVNARYVKDILGALSTDEVEFFVKEELSPLLIKPVDGGADQFVIMPIRST